MLFKAAALALGVTLILYLRKIAMNQQDTTAALTAMMGAVSTLGTNLGTAGTQLVKGLGEVTAKIGELTGSMGGTTPEQDALILSINDGLASANAAATGISDAAAALDAIVPDAPAEAGGAVEKAAAAVTSKAGKSKS